MTPFNELLASALAPITLISGVGLLMLSMSARYNHATTRIRLLMNERLDPKLTDDERADIDEEIDFIFHRAGLLRRGEFCVVLAAVVSGLLVALCVLEEATGFSADILNSALLLASVALIVLSTVFLSLEIRLSLRAIKLVVSKLPPVADAFDDAAAARAAQAVEARHQSHVLNEARRHAEHAAPHEVRKAEGSRCEPEAPHHDDHVTRLSPEAFEAFREQLETGETDPKVLEARERLVKLKPVWHE